MAGLLKQLRNSSHLRWVAPALLVDWIVVIVVNLLAQWVELQYPYKRDAAQYLNDPSLQWPVTEEHVPAGPNSALDNYTFWLPVVVILVVGGVFKRSLHDVHHGFLVFMSSRTLMRIVVECLKNRVGRLRPDFFSRCQWDAVAKACRGPLELVKDGRRSFPSGHSSTSWQAMLFLSLYLAGKNGAFAFAAPFPRSGFLQSRLLRFGLVITPLFLGTWICVTRLEDHRHHPTDVVTGSLIGALSALVMYATYYPSPFIFTAPPGGHCEDELSVMDKPRRVYGAKEADERDAWGYAEEGRVRLVEDAAEEEEEERQIRA